MSQKHVCSRETCGFDPAPPVCEPLPKHDPAPAEDCSELDSFLLCITHLLTTDSDLDSRAAKQYQHLADRARAICIQRGLLEASHAAEPETQFSALFSASSAPLR